MSEFGSDHSRICAAFLRLSREYLAAGGLLQASEKAGEQRPTRQRFTRMPADCRTAATPNSRTSPRKYSWSRTTMRCTNGQREPMNCIAIFIEMSLVDIASLNT